MHQVWIHYNYVHVSIFLYYLTIIFNRSPLVGSWPRFIFWTWYHLFIFVNFMMAGLITRLQIQLWMYWAKVSELLDLAWVHKTPHGLNPSMIKIASCNPVCVPFPAQKHNTHIFIHGILQLLVWLVNESSRTELSGVFEV